MSITRSINSKANIKQYSDADFPINPRQPVIARYNVDSTASQTVINLPFLVDTINAQDSFFLAIDGKVLTLGIANDYIMSSIDVMGFSGTVTLNAAIPAGLNIQAWKLGLKKESEWAQDQRFANLYESLGDSLQSYVAQNILMSATSLTPSVGQFWSTISNRSAIVDFSQDLRPRMGVERVRFSGLSGVQEEMASTGLPIHTITTDPFNRVRFAGSWTNSATSEGTFVSSATSGDYIEVTFYGTGLNLLMDLGHAGMNATYQVDNGVASANIFAATYSAMIDGYYFPTNQILAVVNNLTLGVHTVKISLAAAVALKIYGIEILNASANIITSSGISYGSGKKVVSSSASSTYNSGFESGVLGTTGGRVLEYQKADGTIAKAVQPTNATPAYMASADHTNEEIAKVYQFKEFGAGRGDDFSSAMVTSNRTFILDDGITALLGTSLSSSVTSSGFYPNASGSYFIITFVGTGLDIIRAEDIAGAVDTNTISIDGGASVGSLATLGTTAGLRKVEKICSGLPYGTHTVKFLRTATVSGIYSIEGFKIYRPKTPSLPSGATDLGAYDICANFVANTIAGQNTISTGTIRKQIAIREGTYVGTWTEGIDAVNGVGGWTPTTSTNGDYFEYIFFGVGFDLRYFAAVGRSTNILVSLQNLSTGGTLLAATTTNFPTLTSSLYGVGTFTPSTGILSQANVNTPGSGLILNNLPLSVWKVRLTNQAAAAMEVESLDIITPIHSCCTSKYDSIQNITYSTLEDRRNFSGTLVKGNIGKLTSKVILSGFTGNPNVISTTSTIFVPVPGLSTMIKLDKPTKVSIEYLLAYAVTANLTLYSAFMINGDVLSNEISSITSPSVGYIGEVFNKTSVVLPAGTYTIGVAWKVDNTAAGTLRNDISITKLLIEEI